MVIAKDGPADQMLSLNTVLVIMTFLNGCNVKSETVEVAPEVRKYHLSLFVLLANLMTLENSLRPENTYPHKTKNFSLDFSLAGQHTL